MQSQNLEEIIERVKKDEGLKPAASIKILRPILKAFGSYSTTSETLPPQTLIPVCLFSLPRLFRTLLDITEGTPLDAPPQQAGLRLCLQSYLRGLLRLLSECDEQIRHVVVQSMSQSIQLVSAYPALRRKWLRALVTIWATCGDNLNLGLRCFICFKKAMELGDDQFYIWGLRRIYVGYFEHCGQVNWRTLEHINFMGNCFCQLARLRPTQAYYVLFGYTRALAMQLQSLNNAKSKQKKELITKLYSQQMIQVFRLLGQVVAGGDQELSALTYPFAELMNAYQKVSESVEYLPLKLHVLQIELQLMEKTGLYLPQVLDSLIKLLNSSPLQKRQAKKAGVQGSIQLGYRLSLTQLKNTQILNDIFDKALFYLHWLATLSYRMLGAVQVVRHICKLLANVELGFTGHRKAVKQFCRLLQEDADNLQAIRAKRKLSLVDKALDKFQKYLSSGKIPLKGREHYQELLAEREQLFKAKVIAEQEDEEGEEEEDDVEPEDREEVDSGWEEASEGASDFQDSQAPSDQDGSEEDDNNISYEGDPEDADEAVRQWSEHEWSSQEEAEL